MNTVTLTELYGKEFRDFWKKTHETYPDMPIVYYEIMVDFMDYFYDEQRSLQENMRLAYNYVKEHEYDYD